MHVRRFLEGRDQLTQSEFQSGRRLLPGHLLIDFLLSLLRLLEGLLQVSRFAITRLG